ncbi:MAG: hypothetical protein AAF228_10880 [Pseudomonadota bacterium]
MSEPVSTPDKNGFFLGTRGDDLLDGTNFDDIIVGFSGNDSLYGHNGNDRIIGGNGDDILDGGDGKDQLIGGDGNDLIVIGSKLEDSYLDGGAGDNDVLVAGEIGDKTFAELFEYLGITIDDVETLDFENGYIILKQDVEGAGDITFTGFEKIQASNSVLTDAAAALAALSTGTYVVQPNETGTIFNSGPLDLTQLPEHKVFLSIYSELNLIGPGAEIRSDGTIILNTSYSTNDLG